MHYLSFDTYKLSKRALLILLAIAFFAINISGDHVFNKVNNFKLALVLSCIFPLSIFVLLSVKRFNLKVLLFFFLPLVATLPGVFLSDNQFGYGFPFELMSQATCILWAFLLYCLMQMQGDDEHWKILWVFIPSIYFVCLIGFLEKLGLAPLINIPLNPFEAFSLVQTWEYEGISNRIESTFGNINYFASFLIQALPLTNALFLIVRLQAAKGENNQLILILSSISVAFVLLALILTQTRSAIFAALLSMILFISLLVKIKYFSTRQVIKLGKGFAFLLIIGLITVALESDRFSLLFSKEGWWPRTVPWQAAWESFKSAPVFGYGVGSSYQLFFDYVSSDSRLFAGSRSYNHVHNELLQILQEGGVVGLAVYILFWGLALRLGLKFVLEVNNTDKLRILVSALLCGLVAYHIHGLFSVAPRMMSSRIMAYSLLAFMFSILFKRQQEDSSKLKKSVIRLGFLISIVVITSSIVPFLYAQHQYVKAIISPDKLKILAQLSIEYDDIYIIEAASKEAFEKKDFELLLRLTERANEVFPHYRQIDIYRAYSLFEQGRINEASQLAKEYQIRDRYSSLAMNLLLGIAIDMSSEKAVATQLQRSLEYQACINRLINCDEMNIKVIFGQFAIPFQIRDKGDKWNVLIDQSFLPKLIELKAMKNEHSKTDSLSLIIRLLSLGKFFKPVSLNQTPLYENNYEDLASYLMLLSRDEIASDEALLLKGKLNKIMNLDDFLMKRALLIGLSNNVLSAIKS